MKEGEQGAANLFIGFKARTEVWKLSEEQYK